MTEMIKLGNKSFPVSRLTVGGRSGNELEKEVVRQGISTILISDYLTKKPHLINDGKVTFRKNPTNILVVAISPKDIGMGELNTNYHSHRRTTTIGSFYRSVAALGLELCTIEALAYYAMQHRDEIKETVYVSNHEYGSEEGCIGLYWDRSAFGVIHYFAENKGKTVTYYAPDYNPAERFDSESSGITIALEHKCYGERIYADQKFLFTVPFSFKGLIEDGTPPIQTPAP